jgi:polysaccharide biosynthesis protein PslG
MVGASNWSSRCWAVAAGLLALSLVACNQTQSAAIPTMTQEAATPTMTQEAAAQATTVVPTGTPAAPGSTMAPATSTPGVPLDDRGFADPAFRELWERSDGDVAGGTASRSWLWGPPVPSGARREPYAEASGDERLVEYFDKGRMEINDQHGDPTDPWYVTSGLLTVELVTGRMQVGSDAFENLEPAQIPVAGDLERIDPLTPHYADYAGERLAHAPDRTGQTVTTQFLRGQEDVRIKPPVTVKVAAYDDVSGHNVADVFVNYFDDTLKDMELNPLFVMGRPISEPYWINVRFDGETQLVLVQLFERRALTYNPDNDAGWEVEFANIGLHYYRWRYHNR